MSTLRWLHLSDLHMNQIGTETENIREGLLSYLKRRDMTFDYIFISGDLFYAPKKGNRVDICSYINELLKITRTSKEKLFIVPGNHDVDRDCQERLQAIKEISEEYTSSEGIISDEKMILLSEGKTAYIEQMLQIYNDVPDRCQLYEDRVHPHFCVTTDDLNIIHVDTTLTYSEEKNRDFFIGTHHLKKVLEKIDDHKATIVLTHYPLNYLMQDERKQIEKLLADHNIQLWLAGHEHNELIGGEESIHVFLAGNLMHEQNARSLILTGEINTTTGKGKLEAHYWCSPRDWTKYTTLWRNKNEYCDIYPFELQNYSYKEDVKETCLRKISDGVYAVNLFELEERHFKDISEEDFKEIKAQLGKRLNGNETREQIINYFLTEIQMTLNSDKRIGCMPIFDFVVRGKYKGLLYLDKNIVAATDQVDIVHMYLGEMDRFIVCGEGYQFEIIERGKELLAADFSYNLSDYSSAEKRLYLFSTIRKINFAKSIGILIYINNDRAYTHAHMIEINTRDVFGKRWETLKKETMFWINRMEMVVKVEKFYNIRMRLPKTMSIEENINLDILNDSIHRKCCCTLPGVYLKKSMLEWSILFPEEYLITEDVKLPLVTLLGYTFKPIRQYILPCKLVWKREKKIWETRKGGVPTGVDFELIKDT